MGHFTFKMSDECFFGLEVQCGMKCSTNLECDLMITRAVISPLATENSLARLFMKIKNTEVPLCQLNAIETTASLNILLKAPEEIGFRVAGDTNIIISGYYVPQEEERPQPSISPSNFAL